MPVLEGIAFVVGAAALFSTVLDTFDFVITAKKFTVDFTSLNSLLNSHKLRFYIFGVSYGIVPGLARREVSVDPRLQVPHVAAVIEDNAKSIFVLLEEAQKIVRTYTISDNYNTQATSLHTRSRSLRQSLTVYWQRQKARRFGQTVATWSAFHADRFETIIDRIGDLVDGLYDITSSLDFLEQQRAVLEDEIASTSDAASIRVIRDITASLDESLSITAGHRMSFLLSNETLEHPLLSAGTVSPSGSSFRSARSVLSDAVGGTLLNVGALELPGIAEILSSPPEHRASGSHSRTELGAPLAEMP